MINPQQQQQQRAEQLERERSAAEQAKSLADHPYLNRCLDDLERAYIAKWRDDATLTASGREALWNALQGAVAFRQHLRATISSGAVAHAAIEKLARTGKGA